MTLNFSVFTRFNILKRDPKLFLNFYPSGELKALAENDL